MFTTKKTGIFATLLLALGLMLGVTVTGCTDEDRDRPDVPTPTDVTAYVLPAGYVVSVDEEGNSVILNADEEVVPADELPNECDITPGESQDFVVIAAYTTDGAVTYADVTDKCDAELQVATQEELITNEAFTVNVDAEAEPEEEAAILGIVPVEGLEEATIVPMTINVAGPIVGGLILTADPEEIAVDETSQLTAMYGTADVTAECTFESSDEEIATVDETGLVTGIADGEVTITATYQAEGEEEPATADVTITVGEIVGGLILTADPEEIAVDETSQLTAMYGTEDVTAECTFETSDEAVATVDETGLVTGIADGEVTITATYEAEGEEEPATATVTITVGAAGDDLTVEADATEIEVDGVANLTVTYEDEDVTANCEFESSDDTIATVDEAGVVTGVAEGTVTITASYTPEGAEEALTGTIDITVGGAADELTVEADTTDIEVAGVANLTVTYEDEDVTADCEFESSDDTIATVDEAGVVTGVAEGTVTITASYTPEGAEEAVTGTIEINVAAAAAQLVADPAEVNAVEGDANIDLAVTFNGEAVAAGGYDAETTDDNVAFVNGDGQIVIAGVGECTITIHYDNEGTDVTVEIPVTVTAQP